jgi:uncharacterized repeat protein (TIGR03803 family)
MVFDASGNLYGTTQWGGIVSCGPDGRGGCGTVFQLAPQLDGTWKQNVLHRFAGGTDGALVYSGVIFDSAGNLYGTTASGGDEVGFGNGTAYELSPGAGGWTETLLHVFATESGDGAAPVGGLTFDKSGNLYGTTYQGLNPCGYGTVFQLSPNGQGGSTESVLHCFSGSNSDGTYLSTGVIFDAAGNLYSTTYVGGAYDNGTIFQLTPSGGSWTENILYNFPANSGGPYPYSPLISDKNGNLFGLTYGTVYQLTQSGGNWTYTTIYTGKSGLHGLAMNSLIVDQGGNLYGTAEGGASTNCDGGGCGAVFKLTHKKNGWHAKVLYSFQGGADRATPFGGLVMDQQGNLFGTTYYGGETECVGGCGLVFEVTP